MSTLHTTHRVTPSLRSSVRAGLAAIAVLIAIAIAIGAVLLTHGGVRTTTTTPSIGSADGNSAAYAPPHSYYGAPMPNTAPRATGLTDNNDGSATYTKAQLYTTAR